MATATMHVQIQTKWALRWIHLVKLAAPVIGQDRALGLAKWGVVRLARWRIGNGRWRSLGGER